MEDYILVVLSSVLGLSGGFIIMYIRDILLDKRKRKEERERYLTEKRLEKLYSPLYRNIMTSKAICGREDIVTSKPLSDEGEGWEAIELKKLINNGFYLASEELQPILAEYYYHHVIKKDPKQKEEDSLKLVKIIKDDYKSLRNKYFEIW